MGARRVDNIEKSNFVGGICLHSGTVPSKTFREAILFRLLKNNSTNKFTDTSSRKLFDRK